MEGGFLLEVASLLVEKTLERRFCSCGAQA